MDSLSVENTKRTGERLDIDNVVSDRDRAVKNLRKRSLKEANEFFQTQLTDEGYVIDKATRGTDNRMVYELYHDVKGAGSKVYAMVGQSNGKRYIGGLTNAEGKVVDKSVSEMLAKRLQQT